MLSFIIVDDEPLALESFASLLDWKACGYELAGCAANGARALQLIQEKEPDILFTDIRMPIMDGLELCRQVHEQYPEIRIVILTAYRDFEYAQRALSYGVTEYLLKNQIEPEVILPLLERLSKAIEAQRKQKNMRQRHYYQSLMLNMTPADMPTEISEHRQYCCMFVQCRAPYLYETLAGPSAVEIALDPARIAALAPADGLLAVGQTIWLDAKSWGILLLEKERDLFSFSRTAEAIQTFLDRLRTYFRESYDREIFVLFDLSAGTPERIKGTMERMLKFSAYSIFIERTEIGPYTEMQRRYKNTDENHPALRQTIEQAGEAARHANKAELDNTLHALHTSFSAPFCDLGQFTYICEHLLEQLERLFEKNALPNLKQYALQMQSELCHLFCAEETWQWIVREYGHMASLAAPDREKTQNRKIEQALEYIHENYQKRLTARLVGEQVGLSEVYFSNLFKKETGATFGEYLTAYRINVAKYLIMNGDYKVYEVAEMTGYASPQYFSQIFQKETGRTPLEYKTHGEKGE